MLENIGNAITRLPLGTKLGWSHPTNTSTQNHFLGIGRYCLPHSERCGFMGCRDQTIHSFDDTWWTLCYCVTKVIKSGRITANINTKKP